ncbi:MAG TPA: dTMP kinase [Candidatus Paceibacterota bacterium]|jgi:dTMP kinase|nr:dTMP kinase [Candidatus Paceibacterota bacterium]
MRGKFIIIEGGDGAGKDTQIAMLKRDFLGPAFVYTREPGGTPLGQEMREIVLHEKYGSLPLLTEAFLFLADRAQHASEVIVPAVEEGKVVVSNRSHISMLAYQIYGRGQLELKPLVESAAQMIYHEAPIDLAIILDIPPEVGAARHRAASKTFDVMEGMSLEARTKIREAFLTIAKTMPQAKVIDANRPVDEVYKDVRVAVEECLKKA